MMHGTSAVTFVRVAVSVALSVALQASAQPGRIGTVYSATGDVTVTRQAAARRLVATEEVLVQDTIATGSDSHVRIGFTAGVRAEMNGDTVVTIAEAAGWPVLHLHDGVVSYWISRDGDRPDQALRIDTPNAVARATDSLRAKVAGTPPTGLVTTVCIFGGGGSAATPDGVEVRIPERHCVTVSGGVLGAVSPFPTFPPMTPVPIGLMAE
jgi:FecR protein